MSNTDKNSVSNEKNFSHMLMEELLQSPEFRAAIAAFVRTIISLTPDVARKLTEHVVNGDKKTEEAGTVRFSRKRNIDWSKASDNSLRGAYLFRRRNGLGIESSLNEELAKRFPGYDKEKHTFGNISRSNLMDWSKTGSQVLRCIYGRRKKQGKAIEDALNEELARRFPGYDKVTRSFGNGRELSKLNKDWTRSSDKCLRVAFSNRKKKGLQIEDNLNEELAKRFSGYDKENRCFRKYKRQSVNDWRSCSDLSIRHAYNYRKRNGLQIEEALNEELARRFPGYNKDTKLFGNSFKRTLKKRKSANIINPVFKMPLFSAVTDNNKYGLFFFDGNIDSSLLRSAKAPYELCLYDEKTKLAVVRKQLDGHSGLLYVIDLKRGRILTESKAGAKSVSYIASSHELFLSKAKGRLHTVISDTSDLKKTINIPFAAETIKADSLKKNTVIICEDGHEVCCPVIQILDKNNIERTNQLVAASIGASKKSVVKADEVEENLAVLSDKDQTERMAAKPNADSKKTPKVSKKILANTAERKDVVVTVERVKIAPGGIYNDIFINGEKFIRQHINTKIEFFCEDTILAIHGVVENNPNYPAKPMWLIYDTDLKLKLPQIKHVVSKYNVQATNVWKSGDDLRVDMTNKSTMFLETEQMKKIAKGRRFVLGKTGKTK